MKIPGSSKEFGKFSGGIATHLKQVVTAGLKKGKKYKFRSGTPMLPKAGATSKITGGAKTGISKMTGGILKQIRRRDWTGMSRESKIPHQPGYYKGKI